VTAPGARVLGGRYELRGVLGSGGMGVVYDGWDARLRRSVAVKVLRPELAGQPEVRRRFEAEARAAATLSHPHVVAVHDTGEDAGVPWIVMEQLPGSSLAELLRGGLLPQPQVRTVLEGVLGALALAHDRGILHRDVKPGNVLLAADGAVKVTDFGIAKSAGAADHTAAGMVVGTVAYLSRRGCAVPRRPSPTTCGPPGYSAGSVLSATAPSTGTTCSRWPGPSPTTPPHRCRPRPRASTPSWRGSLTGCWPATPPSGTPMPGPRSPRCGPVRRRPHRPHR